MMLDLDAELEKAEKNLKKEGANIKSIWPTVHIKNIGIIIETRIIVLS